MNEAQNPSCYELAALIAAPGGEMTRRWLFRPAVRPRLDVLIMADCSTRKGFPQPSCTGSEQHAGSTSGGRRGRWCTTTEHVETAPGVSDRLAVVNAGIGRGVRIDRGARAPRWGGSLSRRAAALGPLSVRVAWLLCMPRQSRKKRRGVIDMMEERPYTIGLCRHDFGECRQPPGTGDQPFSSSVQPFVLTRWSRSNAAASFLAS